MEWAERIADWRRHLDLNTGLSAKTKLAYIKDAEVWSRWATGQRISAPDQVTVADVREYRDARETGAGRATATANRRLISLGVFLDFLGRKADNPVRRVEQLQDADQEDGRALARNEWNAVRRQAELAGPLEEALVALFRYAGSRVGEVAPESAKGPIPLLLGDIHIGPRHGKIAIRNGKGNKQRTVPLVAEARDPIYRYLRGAREERVNSWATRRGWTDVQRTWWLSDPAAPVWLGERGPLTVRGVRHLVAQLGDKAGLESPLGPHDLRATFITALLDPAKYGLSRDPAPITVAARLAGHASVETTARYARPNQDDLLRWMTGGETKT